MHELAIAQSVIDIAANHANGRQITKIHLKVGHLRQVVPSALDFSFELASQGTPAEGAALEMEEIPATGTCNECGTESQLQNFPLQCKNCGGFNLKLTAGEELYVESLELEE